MDLTTIGIIVFGGPGLFLVGVLVAEIIRQRDRATYWRDKYRMSLELIQVMEGGPPDSVMPPPDPRLLYSMNEKDPKPIFAIGGVVVGATTSKTSTR